MTEWPQAEVDALKRLHAEAAVELDAFALRCPRPPSKEKIMKRNRNDPWSRQSRRGFLRTALVTALCSEGVIAAAGAAITADLANRRLLYVAVPGIRDYLERGGHGVLVFDVDHGHTFVRRIPARGVGADGKPFNVKGIAANAATGRLYVSTLQFLTCFDLRTDKILWE